jgi:transcriptional regulator with XRE-family HTH domain
VNTLRKTFGERIKLLRRNAEISQENFATECGFARSYMSRIERGTSNVSLDAIERIASGLQVSVEELFKGL